MNRKRLVIIDDDQNIRDGLQAFLSPNFEVECFEDARSFLKKMPNIFPPDCILLDLRMPEMNGFQVQSILNTIGYAVPVIFMSGDADNADVIAAWREGAVGFVLKPFTAREIRSTIDGHLEPKSLHGSATRVEALKDVNLPITLRETEVPLLLGEGLRQRDVEPPWVCRRLPLLRRWSHHGQYEQQVFS